MKNKIILGFLIVLIGIQFVPVDLNTSGSTPKSDFILVEKPPQEIGQLLKNSCYDCHSNNTIYPWFDKIKPVTFWVNHHIEEGKEHLDFSLWGTYTPKQQDHKLEEMLEEIEEKEMPLKSYLLTHGGSEVSMSQLKALEQWVKAR